VSAASCRAIENRGGKMKDVTLNSGEVMTDADSVEERGGVHLGGGEWESDTYVKDFIATKADLVSLAQALVEDVLEQEFFLKLQVSRSWINKLEYVRFRLGRVWDFLPSKVQGGLEEKLRKGREKNEKDAKKYEKDCEREAARWPSD
jgi:hypothetical protein